MFDSFETEAASCTLEPIWIGEMDLLLYQNQVERLGDLADASIATRAATCMRAGSM